MKYFTVLLLILTEAASAQVTPPILSSWILNTTGKTGYGGLPSNVQRVQYSDSNIYVSCSCIPGYDIGPWPGNPNTPTNQNFVFRITRSPIPNTGAKTPTPLGHIGVWSNGVSIFNAKDANSYNNGGIWNQNAIIVEGSSFDECLGHPAPNGEYHHHLNPVCLYNAKDSTHHSPIIGYAFDGYPIYGAYDYSQTDGSGGARRMQSSYRLRNISDRTTLPGGTALSTNQYGPAISSQYPLGYYIEDFEYIASSGDLDENNGRFCVTPEYPTGTYAYFVTIDANGNAAYPYTLGPAYYGVVTTGNTGPGSGHVTISEPVLTYIPSADGVSGTSRDSSTFTIYPNPASNYVVIDYSSTKDFITHIDLIDERGTYVLTQNTTGPTMLLTLTSLPHGNYFASIVTSSGAKYVKRVVRE